MWITAEEMRQIHDEIWPILECYVARVEDRRGLTASHRVGQQSGHGAVRLGEEPAEPWPADLVQPPRDRRRAALRSAPAARPGCTRARALGYPGTRQERIDLLPSSASSYPRQVKDAASGDYGVGAGE
jgi:hypothetical protein